MQDQQQNTSSREDRLIRSLSFFGAVISLYFVISVIFNLEDCAECNVVHTNFNVKPTWLGLLGAVTFALYFISTKVAVVRQHIYMLSMFVFVAEVLLLSIQSIFKTFCFPCVGVGIVFFALLSVLHYKNTKAYVLSVGLGLFAFGVLQLANFQFLNTTSPFASAAITPLTDEPTYLVVQSQCKHCEKLLEELHAKDLLRNINVLSFDKPSQLPDNPKNVKETLYSNANWKSYSNQGLYNFLKTLNVSGTPLLIRVPDMHQIQLSYGNEEILEALTTQTPKHDSEN